MSLVIATEPVPLEIDRDGAARVGGTRVTLESVVVAYCQGATPEEIAQRFPAVRLADVYAVITFYLRHRNDVDEFITDSIARSGQSRQQYASQLDPQNLRERLLAWRKKS
jgi:uncharacterized protein (DUF433 family)